MSNSRKLIFFFLILTLYVNQKKNHDQLKYIFLFQTNQGYFEMKKEEENFCYEGVKHDSSLQNCNTTNQ